MSTFHRKTTVSALQARWEIHRESLVIVFLCTWIRCTITPPHTTSMYRRARSRISRRSFIVVAKSITIVFLRHPRHLVRRVGCSFGVAVGRGRALYSTVEAAARCVCCVCAVYRVFGVVRV